ncbi:MAG TPA: isochorismatase family cysteine hydrolase [Streptosporangiaceae bacterium]|jgi:ureidoacrylate peracid hydrolase
MPIDAASVPPTLAAEAGHTALLLIDLQNAFLHDQGTFGRFGFDVASMRRVVGPCNDLAAAARRRNVPVIFVRYAYRADYADLGIMSEIMPPAVAAGALRNGEWDAELLDEVRVEANDQVVHKNRYSAFHGTGLTQHLRGRGVTTLVVGGVLGNVCVTGTAQDAMQDDFRVFAVADACGSVDQPSNDAALATITLAYGTVTDTRTVTTAWLTPVTEPA